jgi:hypothetical protein
MPIVSLNIHRKRATSLSWRTLRIWGMHSTFWWLIVSFLSMIWSCTKCLGLKGQVRQLDAPMWRSQLQRVVG